MEIIQVLTPGTYMCVAGLDQLRVLVDRVDNAVELAFEVGQ